MICKEIYFKENFIQLQFQIISLWSFEMELFIFRRLFLNTDLFGNGKSLLPENAQINKAYASSVITMKPLIFGNGKNNLKI